MNQRIRELAEQAKGFVDLNQHVGGDKGCMVYTYDGLEKFAELIEKECADLLWDENERLYAYSSECDNMRDSDEAQVVAEKCVDLITMIDQHFGFES